MPVHGGFFIDVRPKIFLRSLPPVIMSASQHQETAELPIAIFDSGIGGLSVLREALLVLPFEKYIYYADTDHVPYGEKKQGRSKRLCIAGR